MDKNQVIGFALIALMVILYMQFFNEVPPIENTATTTDSTTLTTPEITESSTPTQEIFTSSADSVVNAQLENRLGVFAPLGNGKEESIRLENNLITVDINTKGATFDLVLLKNFKASNGDPLSLIEKNRSSISWKITDFQNRNINISNLYFKVKKFDKSKNQLVLTGDINEKQGIEIVYTLSEGKYTLDSSIKLKGLANFVAEKVSFEWIDRIKHQEHDVTVSRNNASANYFTKSEDFETTSARSTSLEEETVNEPIKWFSISQKFFVTGIIADSTFQTGYVSTISDMSDTSTVKIATLKGIAPTSNFLNDKGARFTYYFGPKEYEVLGTITEGFSKNLDLGWPPVSWVNKWVIIPMFNLLSSFIESFGIIIIIMVIIIKIILSPLSYKSYLSMAKMKVLKPELDELKEKNEKEGGDAAKLQQEQLSLYRQVGVNPVSGCIPMVLQMPILFAMFYFFPQSIHLRQQSFLWANDLSTYDVIATLPFSIPGYGSHVSLFVLLMTLSTILYTWSNNQMSSVTGPMKSISYIMPVVLMFVLNSFPAALSFYYFVSNLVTFGQQAIIRRFVNEDKIKAILDENKKRNVNKSKSKFVMKLEEAIKAGEQNQRKKKK